MKNVKKRFNKFLSILLASIIVISMFTCLSVVGAAGNPNFNKVADNATLDGWKEFFGSASGSTENAGAVWTDKSVFADNSHKVFQNLTDAYGNDIIPTVSDDSFLVALSAIASNKSIVGYSHIPTDTVLVLDLSSSMGPRDNNAIAELVAAANSAMTELLSINNNNRIGVALYWGDTTTFLPIDRYTTQNKISGTDTLKFFETNSSRNQIKISAGVKDSKGNSVASKTQQVQTGTYIQGGLGLAADMFEAKSKENDTIISGDGFQAGTQRKPVVVLMTDGSPTYGTTNYADPGKSNLGMGSTSTNNFSFLTQITAAAVKTDITNYYNGSETMFYTFGFRIGNDATARSVLDPKNSTSALVSLWNTYNAASVGSNVTLRDGNRSVTIKKSGKVDDIIYNDAYYSADSNDSLESAFSAMISEIIIQSLYRPTLVENNNANMEGFIEFIDDIGDYMKVEEIEGIMIGDKLFTGEKLSENFRADGGDLGTVDRPNDMGNVLVAAVRERLQIDSIAEARELITNAYTHGQLSYSKQGSKVTFSNYIGWYADEDGKYLGFWCDKHTYKDVPAGAKCINKSYGMLGEISDKYTASDLMYTSIQVHTEIVPQDRFNSKDTDNVMAGHAQLIFRVPAALIPVVTYDVELEGTGYEDARNITMNINDAEPIRLLFEVGLRDDVNEYNIEKALGNNHKNADGEYVFYTNQWSVEQFDKEIDPNNSEYVAPTESINTIAYFEPNYENERYYYNELTPVYVKEGSNYVKYSSNTKPTATDGNVYYRQIHSFELTGNGNEAVLKKTYERISNAAIARIEKSETNGGWNVIKETVHRVYDEIETPKTANLTGTLGYSYFPTVEHIEGTHYYAAAILGNNGVLTVTPATGISITKTVDASLEGNTDRYTFNVKIGDTAAEYSVIRQGSDGMHADFGEKISLDSNGNGTIKLVPGETALIVGMPAGVSYTVSEEVPSGANYEVTKSSGTSGVVEQYHLSKVAFENAIRQSGNLVIAKQIVHPFGTAPASIYNHVFKFDAVLSAGGATYPDATVSAYYSTAPGDTFDLNVVNNKIEGIELKGNQSIIVKIKDGWTATVTEQGNMPNGFTLTNTNASTNKTVTIDRNVEYLFTNTYTPQSVNADVVIDASKILNGRPWNDDSFTFALYRYNKGAAQYEEIARETVNRAGDFGATLTNAIKAEVFTEVGEYHYMVRELVPNETRGVTYDSNYRVFTVVVTDTDTDGKLEIAEIEAESAVNVTASGDKYTVITDDFVNIYKAGGIAEVTIEINKTVNTPDGITYSPEGFEFAVYDNTGKQITPIHETDENGVTQFTFTYDATGVDYQNDRVYSYVIKENDTGLGGITYADDIPFTVTIKDNLDGTISATTNITNKNGDVSVVDVTNVYSTNDISVSLEATKNLTGRGLRDGEFKFDVYSTDTNSVVVDNATNDATGTISFNLPAFTQVGTYNYKVYEDEVNANGVTVDTTQYDVTVIIGHDGEGNLTATVNGVAYNGTPINIGTFNNVYNADSVGVTLEATKELTGRETALADKEFNFAIKDIDNNVVIQDNATNNVNGKVVFNELTFDKVGTYNFVVYENEVNHDGITVDSKQYAVKITVTDDGNGNLVAAISVDNTSVTGSTANAIVFRNTYSANGVDVTLEATKTLTGRPTALKDKEFKFALAKKDGTVIEADATNNASGKVVFDKLTFDKVGTYEYVVYENEVDGNGITVDKTRHNVTIVVTDNDKGQLVATVNGANATTAVNVATFTNTYSTGNTGVVLEATKTLDGRDLRDGEFKFDLYDVDNNKVLQDDVALVLGADGNGKITFNNITFTAAGTYKYAVYEDEVNDKGVTVDTTRYNVTVTVTDDSKGNLVAKVTVNDTQIDGSTADAIVFRNVYAATSTSVTLEATKELTGRDLVAGEFDFAIADNNGNVIEDNATNNADGLVVFSTLTFDKVGTYNYVVYENEVDGKGVTVDTTEYAVQVVVTDNGEGNLVAAVYVNGAAVSGSTASAIVFENNYKAEKTDIVISANKVLDGRELVDGEFTFELYSGDELVATAKNNADGLIVFENIAIDEAGEYVFTVKEVKGDDQNVAYDETVYTVTVTVTDNLDGTFSVDYAYENGEDEVEAIVFNNKYTEPTPDPEPTPEPEPQPEPTPEPESPNTGDNVSLAGWLAVVFTSGAILFATGKKLKKVKNS